MAIQLLSKDPMLCIFSYLNMHQLPIAARVSKLWNVFASHDTLWFRIASMHLPYFPPPPPHGVLWKVYFQHLRISEVVWKRNVFYSAFGNTIGCWDAPIRRETRHRFTSTSIPNSGIISCFALRQIGLHTFMITGSIDGSIKVWMKESQTSQFKMQIELCSHKAAISRISGIGNNFFSGDEKGSLCFWEHSSKEPLYKLKDQASAHLAKISCMANSTKGVPVLLFTGSHDATIKIWKLKEDQLHGYQSLKHDREPIDSICYSTLQKILFSGTDRGTIRLWRNDGTGNFSFTHKFNATNQAITRIYSFHKSPLLAITDANLSLQIWMGSKDSCEKWELQSNFSFKGDGVNACIAEDFDLQGGSKLLVYYADQSRIQKKRLADGGCKLLSSCSIPIPPMQDSCSEDVHVMEVVYSPD